MLAAARVAVGANSVYRTTIPNENKGRKISRCRLTRDDAYSENGREPLVCADERTHLWRVYLSLRAPDVSLRQPRGEGGSYKVGPWHRDNIGCKSRARGTGCSPSYVMTEAERAFYDNRRRDGAARMNAACLAPCRSRDLYDKCTTRARLAISAEETHRPVSLFERYSTLYSSERRKLNLRARLMPGSDWYLSVRCDNNIIMRTIV